MAWARRRRGDGMQVQETLREQFPRGVPQQWFLASDRVTDADISAGRRPSYALTYVKPDGTLDVLRVANKPQRLIFDPQDEQAAREALGRRGDFWSRTQGNMRHIITGQDNWVNAFTGDPVLWGR